jgi:hypothetical protein
MSEFNVGDRVRIKDDAAADGWLRPGETGTISAIDSDGDLWFDNPDKSWHGRSIYYACEVDHEPLPLRDGRAYLAGPMRGIPEFNFPAFLKAAEDLKAKGIEVFNPAQHDIDNGFDYKGLTGNEDLSPLGFDLRKALGADVDFIAHESAGVIVLPGWENSSGARAEVALANALKLPVVTLEEALEWGPKWEQAPQVGDGFMSNEWRARSNRAPGPALDILVPPREVFLSHQAGEVRSVSSTGGEKGTKAERHDLIPVEALATVARHYGVGAAKYEAHNWRRGYEWSKSYAALQRHATAFWSGEDIDEETGSPHMAAVAFHALTLLTFMEEQPGFDDRYKKESISA